MTPIKNIISILIITSYIYACPLVGQVSLVMQNQEVSQGSKFILPIDIQNSSRLGAAGIELEYDPAVIQFESAVLGSASQNGLIESNEQSPGTLLIGLVDAQGIESDGNLLNIRFNAIGTEGSKTEIIFSAECWNAEVVDLIVSTTSATIIIGKKGFFSMWMYVALGLVVLFTILVSRRNKSKQKIDHKTGSKGNFCPNCGTSVNQSNQFCGKCGHKLDK